MVDAVVNPSAEPTFQINHNEPRSAQEALARGMTWFIAKRKCGRHNSVFHWAHNGTCMACRDFDGQPYLVAPTVKTISAPRRESHDQ